MTQHGTGMTRRGFASLIASAAVTFTSRDVHARRRLFEIVEPPLPEMHRILVFPGYHHLSWGHPRLRAAVRRFPGTGLFHYDVPDRWDDDLWLMVRSLETHLRDGPTIVVGYSKGGCAALDVVAHADLSASELGRLQMLLVAPAARVRGVPRFLRPRCVSGWAARWNAAEARLRERARERAWCNFVEQHVRVLYSREDWLIDPRGLDEILRILPERRVRDVVGMWDHLKWRKSHELLEEVFSMLGGRIRDVCPEEVGDTPLAWVP